MPNTSLKCAIKESIDRITGLFEFYKDSAHWRALPVSREMTKGMGQAEADEVSEDRSAVRSDVASLVIGSGSMLSSSSFSF